MPMQTVWIEPELLLEHRGVRVYYVYKDDDYDQGIRRYFFTLAPHCGEELSRCGSHPCRHVFDVRELATWQPPVQPASCLGAHDTPENRAAWDRYWELEAGAIRAAITAAIEHGAIQPDGCRSMGEF